MELRLKLRFKLTLTHLSNTIITNIGVAQIDALNWRRHRHPSRLGNIAQHLKILLRFTVVAVIIAVDQGVYSLGKVLEAQVPGED